MEGVGAVVQLNRKSGEGVAGSTDKVRDIDVVGRRRFLEIWRKELG